MKAEAHRKSGSDGALSGTVRSQDHVQVRSRAELDMIICHEVDELHPDDRPFDIAGCQA